MLCHIHITVEGQSVSLPKPHFLLVNLLNPFLRAFVSAQCGTVVCSHNAGQLHATPFWPCLTVT